MAKSYWLMKSEPEVYSIDDLRRDGSTAWEGVRNFKARNNMRAMALGDEVLFYHSNANPPGVAGIARVSRLARFRPRRARSWSGACRPCRSWAPG